MSETILPKQLSSNSETIDKLLFDTEAELLLAVHNYCKLGIQPIEIKYLKLIQGFKASISEIDSSTESISKLLLSFNASMETIKSQIDVFNKKTNPELASNLELKNNKFLKTISYVFEKIPYKVNALHAHGSTKIRFYLICNSFKHKEIDFELYKALSFLGSLTHQKITKSISEIIDKTFHLFDVNPFVKESINLVKVVIDTSLQEISQLLNEEEAAIAKVNQNFSNKLTLACRSFTNSTLEWCNVEKPIESYRNILSPENISRAETLWERSTKFPEAWISNQTQSHNNQVTDLSLAIFHGKINRNLHKICDKIDRKINLKIDKQLISINSVTDLLSDQLVKYKPTEITDKLNFDDSLFMNTSDLLEQFVDETNNDFREISEEVELMGAKLLTKYEHLQFGALSPVTLGLSNIVKQIIDTKLYGPLKPIADNYISEITNLYDDIGNRINLVKYSITESMDKSQATALVGQVNQLVSEHEKAYNNTKLKFGENIRKILSDLHNDLRSEYIVLNPEGWHQPFANYTRKSIANRISKFVKGKYFGIYKSINETIADKRHASVVSNFDNQHNLKTDVEFAREFVNDADLASISGKKLPFYYKQLFEGKHIPVKGKYIGRGALIENIIKRNSVEKELSILIGGSAGSGKTHFAKHLSTLFGNKHVYYIKACNGQANERSMDQAFSKACKIEGKANTILKSIKQKSVFIIDDLESWWDRTLEKDPLLSILELVKKYRKKHKFIVTSNLYAIEAFRTQRKFQQSISLSVSLAPMSKEAIKEILLERHELGGLDLELKEEYNEFNSRNFDYFMSTLYYSCKGNVGLAQQIWLQQISNVSQNVISMSQVMTKSLNHVRNAYWQWILYQMLINDGLTTNLITKLFREEADYINIMINDLAASGIVIKKGSHDAFIKAQVKPAVEQWLIESGLLN